MHLTKTFTHLLQAFRGVFTQPTFTTFLLLVTGWLLSSRQRYITECIFACAAVGWGHWSRFHRFFSQAAWSLDELWYTLARLLIARFVPTGPILLAGDDTLCRKRGLSLFGGGMHYDPLLSSKALKVCSWGHDWVVLFLLVSGLPWAPHKVWALPIACRWYKNRQGLAKGAKGQPPPADPSHRTRPELLVALLELVARWFPDRQFVLSADSLYGGKSVLQHLPTNIDLISHVHPDGVLYAPAPPRQPGQKGRARTKGDRLDSLPEWADDISAPWERLIFDQFGLHTTLLVKTQKALYYAAGKARLLTIVLTRDADGKRPDCRFYCTRLDWDARTILSAYASRWACEVTFCDSKQLLGFEDPANRLPQAVQRTAPVALVLYSLVVLWCDLGGQQYVEWPWRPWYRAKREPSFADLLSALRRQSWWEKVRGLVGTVPRAKKALTHLVEMASRAG